MPFEAFFDCKKGGYHADGLSARPNPTQTATAGCGKPIRQSGEPEPSADGVGGADARAGAISPT